MRNAGICLLVCQNYTASESRRHVSRENVKYINHYRFRKESPVSGAKPDKLRFVPLTQTRLFLRHISGLPSYL